MKNLFSVLLLFALLAYSSCQKDVIEQVDTVQQNPGLNKIEVTLYEGMLNFESLEKFTGALEELSDTETKKINQESVRTWSKEMGYSPYLFQSESEKESNYYNEYDIVPPQSKILPKSCIRFS